MKKLGKIIIYYGEGEGKTAAALGRAIRVAGYGKKVIILQFMKGMETGEYNFLKKIQNQKIFPIEIYLMGPKVFLINKKSRVLHQKKANPVLKLAQKIIKDQKCNLLILDEILYALKFKLLKEKDILNLLKGRKKIHIILTGNFLSQKLRKSADQVSKISKIKHYFYKGQKKIKGLEY